MPTFATSSIPRSPRPITFRTLGLLALGLWAGACSGADGTASAGGGPSLRAGTPRSSDSLLVAARNALDDGALSLAVELIGQLGVGPGSQVTTGADPVEALLLGARLAAYGGDPVEVSRLIEQARERGPRDDRVYSTAAELHAAKGRLETAAAELQRGVTVCGATPALQRAQGIILICTQGRAREGLKALEGALAADPELPFVGRPLSQAHLLVGKHTMGAGDPALAFEHAEKAVDFDPTDVDARHFYAECSISTGDLGRAIAVYEELHAEGEPLTVELSTLCKNAGVAALVQREREVAIDYFMRARELGLNDAELATGVDVLRQTATALLEQSRAQREAGDSKTAEELAEEAAFVDVTLEAAQLDLADFDLERGISAAAAGQAREAAQHFEAALAHDPDYLEAHHFLAATLFGLDDFEGAANHWTWVSTTAALESLELPEPVHVRLAEALERAGRPDEARATLEEYLRTSPQGSFLQETREALEGLGG